VRRRSTLVKSLGAGARPTSSRMVYDYTWVYSNGVSVLVQNTRGSGHCAAMRWSIGVHDRDMHDRDKDEDVYYGTVK